ncbi:hypothetical protein IFM89_035145 [Coptis chinensis]|uniref:Uncharacterized protein n=1 Tax=Coptis chinensis TaxID=261450 RepID=A0A835MAX7_9MAGN|nr:hypothetical protein IFM89_035145 [Coptis chinensis]
MFAITDCLHVLNLYRKSRLGLGRSQTPAKSKHPDTKPKGAADIVRSAVMLHEAGIEFRTSATSSIMDISFDHGVLKLPTIVVDDTIESTFLNLIAFGALACLSR